VKRIGILFDFDGTLSPLNVSRDVAKIRDDVVAVLKELAKGYVLGVVSSKDCNFLLSKAPFFHSYVCVNGLEILTNEYMLLDSVVIGKNLLKAIEDVYFEAKELQNVIIEEKRSLLGFLLGISIDWREYGKPPENLGNVIKIAVSKGLHIVSYKHSPFVDIYVSRKNKGEAVKMLRAVLNLEKLIYAGDGENDIPAFKVADIAVFIRHDFNQELKLDVDYEVKFEELGRWLVDYVLSGRLP
jgi:hydroxymethylpyrimidine pyrophosphatase-like HAD family hydrolase